MTVELHPALAAFRRLNLLLMERAFTHWRDLDLSMAQLKALMTLHDEEGLTLSALAGKLGTRPSATSVLVDRLVNQGLVRRVEDEADRRRVLLSLTEQAQEVVGRTREGRARIGEWMASLTPEEQAALTLGLEALLRAAESADSNPNLS